MSKTSLSRGLAGQARERLGVCASSAAGTNNAKKTVTEIDTRQAGEGERMQLSNFWLIENSESHDLEIYLTRLNENPEETFTANAYKYTLSF